MNIRKKLRSFSEFFNNSIIRDKFITSNKAFTLSESLIMMAIVGVIAVITMVSLSSLKPNKDKMLLQKAYSATLTAVAEITNDPVAYPPLKSATLEPNILFKISKKISLASSEDPEMYNKPDLDLESASSSEKLPESGTPEDSNTDDSTSDVTLTKASVVLTDRSIPTRDTGKYTSTNKFAYLFANKMVYKKINKNGGDLLTCTNNACSFKTNDGISWTVTDNFKENDASSTSTVLVDINDAKGPNKAYNSSKPNAAPDRFTFTIKANGQVTVSETDVFAQKYLKTRDSK